MPVIARFGAIYFSWGSTFLAARFAIETIPPFAMVSFRFLAAGAILFLWAIVRGAPRPSWTHWRSATIVSSLLFVTGMGAGAWALQFVPSGLVAVLISTAPLWMVMLDWLWFSGGRPSSVTFLGLALGLVGIIVIMDPSSLSNLGEDQIGSTGTVLGLGVLLLSAFSWAVGSLYSKKAQLPKTPALASGIQMLAGGVLLLGLSAVTGDLSELATAQVSLRSSLSIAYLILFGSVVGFSAYFWLLRESTPARVSTYAYINPIVALILGWALAGEVLTLRTLMATMVILAGVTLITIYGKKTPRPPHETECAPQCGAIPADLKRSSEALEHGSVA